MSSARRVIAVFGATGQQGGAVFRALASTSEFIVRGITRNPTSETAQQLLESVPKKNAELVSADVNDEKSLLTALTGAWGAFLVTTFNPHTTNEEEKQAKLVADSAIKAGVKFFTFSSLVDAKSLSQGRHEVHHFTAKNHAEQYIRTLPFADGVAFPYAGMFASNFLTMMKPRPSAKDGVYEIMNILRSDVAVPLVDVEEEFGATVKEIFTHYTKYNKQALYTGSYITMPQLAEAFSKAVGKPARYVQLPLEAGKNFGQEINDMLQFFNNFGYYGGAPINNIVKRTDVEAFFKRNAAQF